MACSSFFRMRRMRATNGRSAIDETAWGCERRAAQSPLWENCSDRVTSISAYAWAAGCGPPPTRRSSAPAPAAPSRRRSIPSAGRTTPIRRFVAADSPDCLAPHVGQFVQQHHLQLLRVPAGQRGGGKQDHRAKTPTRIGAAMRSQIATPTRYDIFSEAANCRHISRNPGVFQRTALPPQTFRPSSPAVVSAKLSGADKPRARAGTSRPGSVPPEVVRRSCVKALRPAGRRRRSRLVPMQRSRPARSHRSGHAPSQGQRCLAEAGASFASLRGQSLRAPRPRAISYPRHQVTHRGGRPQPIPCQQSHCSHRPANPEIVQHRPARNLPESIADHDRIPFVLGNDSGLTVIGD